MSYITFNPTETLTERLGSFEAKDAVWLGIGLCRCVERSVGTGGCHGGIYPGNVSCTYGQVALGPESSAGFAGAKLELLEYTAPERYWTGLSSARCDVYSAGLLLYAALNGGLLPFLSGQDDRSARVRAMQRRLRGEPFPPPALASSALAEVVMKALRFQARERYESPTGLRKALSLLPLSTYLPPSAAAEAAEGGPEPSRADAEGPALPPADGPRTEANGPVGTAEPSRAVPEQAEGAAGENAAASDDPSSALWPEADAPEDADEKAHPRAQGKKSDGMRRLSALTHGNGRPSRVEQVMRTLVSGRAEDTQRDAEVSPE